MLDLQTPQRQSKKVILLYLFKSIKGLLLYFLFAIFGTSSFGEGSIYIMGFTFFLAFVSLINPIIKYWFFQFHIEGDELILQKGLLQKERKAIPLERIQSININQNLGQRILRIVSLEVETAGSKAKELEIPGLDDSYARQLKDLLDGRKQQQVAASDTDLEIPETTDEPELTTEIPHSQAKESLVMELGLIDLLKVGITQNHLRSGFLALGVVFGFWYKIKDLVEALFGDVMEGLTWDNMISSASLGLMTTALLVFLVVSILLSLITTVNKYWDFRVIKRADHLEVRMGLLNKREVKIPLSKVQILEFHSNPLRRLLGFKTALIFQANSESQKASNVSIPACTPEHQEQLQDIIFQETRQAPLMTLASNPWSHARLNFYIMSVICVPLAILAYWFEMYWGLAVPVVLLISSCFFAYQYGKFSFILKEADFAVFKTGWLFPKEMITPTYKSQAVEKWRSIFLKRRKETHFKLHTAAGSRGLRYLKEQEVDDLLNAVNNQVISSQASWM
ncbi:PH domain-containing protein [Nonlabens xiamenensis]|uniref:PH domain-containing protein n=1 Tax=Nonlabens xiamenensis TaxID=2341043 RepID=UPI000F60F1B8|nr:PH domain-containing protein [Nonlabens xiamenensis]